jgi:hypothetical protein
MKMRNSLENKILENGEEKNPGGKPEFFMMVTRFSKEAGFGGGRFERRRVRPEERERRPVT